MREARLRWLGHVKRKEKEEAVKWTLEVQGKRSKGRPKLRWKDVMEKDKKGQKRQKTMEAEISVCRSPKGIKRGKKTKK